jgi:hypothetical protein
MDGDILTRRPISRIPTPAALITHMLCLTSKVRAFLLFFINTWIPYGFQVLLLF